MKQYDKILNGGDLRSIGKANEVVESITNQTKFDELFKYLFHKNRKVVMRTADAVEKITIKNSRLLQSHKNKLLDLCYESINKELKWHLALLLSRLEMNKIEFDQVWQILKKWAMDKQESKIVRVNSVQSLYILLKGKNELTQDFNMIIGQILTENISSLNARIRKIKNL